MKECWKAEIFVENEANFDILAVLYMYVKYFCYVTRLWHS
jgi:hypothetical protein